MPKILIVEESPTVRALIGAALERRRIDVLGAASGAEALECIEREQPDLVVSDVYMPDMDGYRICDFVRAHSDLKTTPVLLMADIVDRSVLARAARAGSDDVVRKPCPSDELLGRIEELVPDQLGGAVVEPWDVAPATDALADLGTMLARFVSLPGVAWAALADREGFVVEHTGERGADVEMAAALLSSLIEPSEATGRELGQGALRSMTFEYDEGLVWLANAGPAGRLAVLLRDRAAMDAVRRCAKEMVPALAQVR